MNDYWHIPRASLASSSSASSAVSLGSSSHRSNKSHAHQPTQTKAPPTQLQIAEKHNATNYGLQRSSGNQLTTVSPSSAKTATHANRLNKNSQKFSEMSATAAPTTNAAATAAAAAAVLAAAKRGSRSSQGSSDSNNSTRSAASGSLLLTAANLERFAEIQKKQQKLHKLYLQQLPNVHQTNAAQLGAATIYDANLVHTLGAKGVKQLGNACENRNQQSNNDNNTNDNDAIITMDPNLDFIKTKDLDTVSIASSMHFTMVNGEGGPPKKPKRGLCDRGRQVTVLIISMSTVFLLLIMGMVYALEMRARDMPQS